MLNNMADPGDDGREHVQQYNVRVHSVLQDDGTVAVMIMNTATSSSTVNVNINGDVLISNGIRYSTTGTGMTTTAVSGVGSAFGVSVPGRTYLHLPALLHPRGHSAATATGRQAATGPARPRPTASTTPRGSEPPLFPLET